MAKLKVVYEATPSGPVAVAAYAEATAVGEDTLAATKVKVDVNDHGRDQPPSSGPGGILVEHGGWRC